jgi:hypothetical protein
LKHTYLDEINKLFHVEEFTEKESYHFEIKEKEENTVDEIEKKIFSFPLLNNSKNLFEN